ncbi:MAG: DUF4340 domain-containing protein [Pseudomonadota bacterium]
MRKNTNRILSILLISQLALIAFFYWPAGEKKPAPTELVTGLAAGSVRELTITDDGAKSITLEKDDSGQWQVNGDTPPPLPADGKQMEKILASLTSLQSQRLVTRTKSSHMRLQVGDRVFARKISLRGTNGESRTLFLGTAPGQQSIHVRAEGSDDVYLAKGISAWELNTDKDSWLAKEYLVIDRDKLKELRLKNSHGSFILEKAEKGWQLEGIDVSQRATAPDAVDALLQRATRLTLHEYLGKEKPADSLDGGTLTLVTETGTVTVDIGAQKDKDNFHVVKSSASPFYVTVSDYQIKPLLDMTAENLTAGGSEN